jgi:DNA-binding MarR family transcriptional regulator/GNAT superfamily N-acetyltransferase
MSETTVAAVRRFSRFYTTQLCLLDEGLLHSDFSLTEARVLYELANHLDRTASALSRDLGIDPGYLSRLLKSFEQRGLLTRYVSPTDARQSVLELTVAGRDAFAPLDHASRQQILAITNHLSREDAGQLTQAMQTVERLMTPRAAGPVTFRDHRLGDIGLIASRQAIVYAQEYDWNQEYEILAAEILASLVKNFDPAHEKSWIAERDGAVIGSVFVVRASDTVAKLRLLYVEPTARGIGLGRRLVDECISFARATNYKKLTLWTNDVLIPARRIYQQAGFTCSVTEPHHAFGHDLISETWELVL